MELLDDIIGYIELHDTAGIRNCFENGLDPNSIFRGEPLIYELTSEYLRSSRFKSCVRIFIEYGLKVNDPLLLAILCDDSNALTKLLKADASLIHKRYNMRCSYTPLLEASLLHLCAEYNHVECAKILFEYGIDVDTLAGIDEHGFGGQSPIFHTVNQNNNNSSEMLDLLLDNNASLDIQVKALIWGQSYEWETLIPSVNPISYAMMGLLPQFHRDEKTISDIVSRLINKQYGIDYSQINVPCKYLLNDH